MPLTLSQRPEIAAKFLWTEQFTAVKPCEISNLKHVKRCCLLSPWTHSLLRRTGIVGDTTPLEETVETDSERGD
ncbi:hypothetical protein Taro_008830 [Colocasia esculenta]|uniref:Uncharacterized protein n=1 Tax=Colocasia esculenta TaxID=4460 RepID=A0A843U3B7_COLES|nr:hypothetical protein [Colocasia esculenta]